MNMGKVTKEMKIYNEGMERALRIAKEKGIQALEEEMRYRSVNPLPLNVSPEEIRQVARGYVPEMLMTTAVSMATALNEDLNLPPSVIVKFLVGFNNRCEEFFADAEKFKAAQAKLERDVSFQDIYKSYEKIMKDFEEEKKNG